MSLLIVSLIMEWVWAPWWILDEAFLFVYLFYEMTEFPQKNMNTLSHYWCFNKAQKGHLKQSRSVNFENFSSVPTMGAPKAVTIYVKTQSLAKNGSHQKWLHEALPPSPISHFVILLVNTLPPRQLTYENVQLRIIISGRFLFSIYICISKHMNIPWLIRTIQLRL